MSRRSVWVCHLAAGVLTCAAYVVVPALHRGDGAPIALGLWALAGVCAGIAINRPRDRLPWICFACGIALFWLGVVDVTLAGDSGAGRPMPTLADILQLGAYAPVVAGLTIASRARAARTHAGSLVDALIITLGLSLVPAVLVIAPSVSHADLDAGTRVMLIGRALGDLLTLGATVRLALDGGRRSPALAILTASVVVMLGDDLATAVARLDGAVGAGVWLEAARFGFYLLWAAAALHPSMSRLSEPASTADERLTAGRLGLLAGATLIAPGFAIVDSAWRSHWDSLAAAAASAALFCLVVSRMAGLVRQRERAAARERALTAAGGLLVGASDPQEIAIAALQALAELGGDGAQARLCRLAGDGGRVLAIDDRGALVDWTVDQGVAALVGDRSAGASLSLPLYAREQLRLAQGDRVLRLELGAGAAG
ncbi:MAG TPA: hypothetical protein VKV27_01755, partial [Solirubrobacteraceae bacterium]|nr:hypothetical protein [Solirubrobacteraceae bacterium]